MARSSSGSSTELSYAGPPYTQETYEPHSDEAPLQSLPHLPEATILTYPDPDPDSAERLNADPARSPDTGSPPRRDGRYDRRVSLSTISLEPRRRRHTQQHERRHTYDDFKRLMTLAERDAKDMRRSLRTALERVEQSRGRAEHAERIALEMAARLREANEERMTALRAGSAAREELGMYKIQFQTAQAEIRRAQDLLGDQDVLRREAEASAARARDTARALKQAHLVEQAIEEGRRMGYREGVRAGQRKGFWDGRMDDRRQRQGDGDEYLYDDDRRSADYDGPDVDFDDDIDADPRAAVRQTPVPGQPRLPSAAASVAGRVSEGRAPEGRAPDPRPALGLDGIGVNLHTLERPPPSPSMSDCTFVAPPPGAVNERPIAMPSPTPLSMQVPRHASPSLTSTTTLPAAPPPNGSPLYNRAPRLPEPNVPPTIPEVVNTEPSSSRRSSSRRQSQPSSHRQSQRPPSIYSPSPSPSPPPPIIHYDPTPRTPVYVPPVPVTPPPGEFSYVMAPTPPPPQSPSPSMARAGHPRSQSERVPGGRDNDWLRRGPPGPDAPRAASASVRDSPNHRPRNDGLPRTWVPAHPTRPAPLAPQAPTQQPMQIPASPRNIYAPRRAASASTNSFYAAPRADGYARPLSVAGSPRRRDGYGRPLSAAGSPGRRDGARVLVSEGGVDEPNIFLESPSLHSTLERTPRTTEDSQFRAQTQDPNQYLSPNRPVVPLPQPQPQPQPQRSQPPSRPPSQSQQRAQPQPPPSLYTNVPGPADGAWPTPIIRGRPPSTVSSSSSPTGYFSNKTTTAQTGPDPNAVRREPGATERVLAGFDMAPAPAQGANLQRSRRTQKERGPPPMVYAPSPGSPRAATPVLQVRAPAPGALPHPQRSPRANGAPLPVPAPRASSPVPLMTPGSRNARLPHHHHYRGESGEAAALPPGRPGSPYRHYDPRADADIARLAAESAERLAGV